MRLLSCTPDRHAAAILAIFNDAIANSTALYEYRPRTPEVIAEWFAAKARGGFPVIGIEDEVGRLLGFGSYGNFRTWAAFKYSVEHSVYVHAAHRGQGVGSLLLQALIEAARGQDRHVMVAGIDMENRPSIALHERFGFTHAGTIRQAGFKFGRWLDLGFYQLILDSPARPVGD